MLSLKAGFSACCIQTDTNCLKFTVTFDRIDRLWRLKKAIFRKTGFLNCHAYLLEKLQKKDDHVDFTSTYILSIIQTNVRI